MSCRVLDRKALQMIEEELCNPEILKTKLKISQEKEASNVSVLVKETEDLEVEIASLSEQKNRLIDLYTNSEITRVEYRIKNLSYDKDIKTKEAKRSELLNKIPIDHNKKDLDFIIQQYCTLAKLQLEKSTTFETKRVFILSRISKVICRDNSITLCGAIPVNGKSRIEFEITRDVTSRDRSRWFR